ncbi:hypothetical protein M5C97_22025 [Acidovorax sp. NCPPB 3859]|nr:MULTISPECIES: hypothetical protein [unclassified Acidovorax]MDA8452306.1 hypothetical protein [Acidovorax sp. GBBC 3297]MDA8461752.1 hypothetical protein [Acidovorax sp. GBBC 3333]MDA8466785.1 hypothetical protein [Acidovorax sp. GBBC 3332]MDA8471801.1 hypothetical protein [Acidovorax sp. GBBC 3299]WCM78145.1 hypothetical protein M5C94_21970 [Acidovorax sp. GBBC 712]
MAFMRKKAIKKIAQNDGAGGAQDDPMVSPDAVRAMRSMPVKVPGLRPVFVTTPGFLLALILQ